MAKEESNKCLNFLKTKSKFIWNYLTVPVKIDVLIFKRLSKVNMTFIGYTWEIWTHANSRGPNRNVCFAKTADESYFNLVSKWWEPFINFV